MAIGGKMMNDETSGAARKGDPYGSKIVQNSDD
jgi:hypothetical protein